MLELDPELGRHGPRVVLLTLGSILPGVALHPKAMRLHAVVARLAVVPSIAWIDCQSQDVMNFWEFDTVAGLGIGVGPARCNPTIWKLRFRDMLSAEFYVRIRWNFWRLHYQFIMANDRHAPYDYFMLTCGPVAVATWAKDTFAVTEAFAEDAALAEDRMASPVTA